MIHVLTTPTVHEVDGPGELEVPTSRSNDLLVAVTVLSLDGGADPSIQFAVDLSEPSRVPVQGNTPRYAGWRPGEGLAWSTVWSSESLTADMGRCTTSALVPLSGRIVKSGRVRWILADGAISGRFSLTVASSAT
jgi:hypothetical protein